jgi:hypothetical protein
MLEILGLSVAEAGRGQVVVPTAPTGADQVVFPHFSGVALLDSVLPD